jgi:Flp pilus assembly protein TadG
MKTRARCPAVGQELVEFALTAPILLMLIFGIFDLGRVIINLDALTNGVREGARYASVHNSDVSGVYNAIYSRVPGLDTAELTIASPVWSYNDINPASSFVRVTAFYDFKPITPFIAEILGGSKTVTLTRQATMRLEDLKP